MVRILLLFALVPVILFSQNIDIAKDRWQLIGSTYDLNLSQLNLNSADTIWTYMDGKWFCYKQDYETSNRCSSINFIEGGRGFWIYSIFDNTLTIDETNQRGMKLKSGWNLVTLGDNIVASDYFNDENILAVWGYKNGTWCLYTPDNITLNGVEKLTTINSNDAVWIYVKNGWIENSVFAGNFESFLNNGNFLKVEKKSSDNIENIWNISFKIDTSNLSDFKIGIKFIKESSGAVGEVVFKGLNITDGKITDPSYIIIYGEKSNEDNGETYFYSNYNPNGILSNSITLNGDLLTLKLGTIMKVQSIVDESTFKAVSKYHIVIASDKLPIKESKTVSLNSLTTYNYSFNSNGLEGYIEIK